MTLRVLPLLPPVLLQIFPCNLVVFCVFFLNAMSLLITATISQCFISKIFVHLQNYKAWMLLVVSEMFYTILWFVCSCYVFGLTECFNLASHQFKSTPSASAYRTCWMKHAEFRENDTVWIRKWHFSQKTVAEVMQSSRIKWETRGQH